MTALSDRVLNMLASVPVTVLLSPVLLAQGLWVHARTPRLPEAAGPREGHVGDGETLHLVALGDSIIAGVGVEATAEALPAQLAEALAGQLDGRVCWSSHGANGARTRDLLSLDADPGWRNAGLMVISNGLNDITALTSLANFRMEKAALYARLASLAPNALIAQVGLPPLGHFPALPQPLRAVLGARARRFERALQSLIDSLENVVYLPFREVPDTALFAADGYHPGPAAVRIWAGHLAIGIARALRAPRSEGQGTGNR
jgi:lysophospholipase L1-like esterase